jgi:hypothetical protein
VIYSAPERWPEARRYALFEVIDVPGNVSLSAVYFEKVPGLDAELVSKLFKLLLSMVYYGVS